MGRACQQLCFVHFRMNGRASVVWWGKEGFQYLLAFPQGILSFFYLLRVQQQKAWGVFFSFIPSFAYPCGLSLQAPFQNNPLFQGGESSNLTVQDGGWRWEEGRCSSGRLTGPLFSGSPLSVPCASDPRALLSFQQKKHHLSFIARLLLLDFVLLILSSTFKYPHIR